MNSFDIDGGVLITSEKVILDRKLLKGILAFWKNNPLSIVDREIIRDYPETGIGLHGDKIAACGIIVIDTEVLGVIRWVTYDAPGKRTAVAVTAFDLDKQVSQSAIAEILDLIQHQYYTQKISHLLVEVPSTSQAMELMTGVWRSYATQYGAEISDTLKRLGKGRSVMKIDKLSNRQDLVKEVTYWLVQFDIEQQEMFIPGVDYIKLASTSADYVKEINKWVKNNIDLIWVSLIQGKFAGLCSLRKTGIQLRIGLFFMTPDNRNKGYGVEFYRKVLKGVSGQSSYLKVVRHTTSSNNKFMKRFSERYLGRPVFTAFTNIAL